MCLSTSPQYQPVCYNALLATSLQTHIKQDVEKLQHKIQKKVTDKTGETIWTIGVSSYSIVVKQEFLLNTKIEPIADNMRLNLNRNESLVTLTWSF